MDIKLSSEHELLRQAVRDFAEHEVAPHAAEIDRTRQFPMASFKKAAELGLTGVYFPEEYGGAGMDTLSYVIAIEEVSRACASTGVILSVQNSLAANPIWKFGTDAAKKHYLTPLLKGERVGAFCLSEPGSGSDAAALITRITRDGDGYIVNGVKNYVTNGTAAEIFVVFATRDQAQGHKGVCAIIVDKKMAGVRIAKDEHKMGITASGSCQIAFDEVRVPAENLLGKEGDGFKIALNTLDGGRIGIAAQAVGIAQAAFDVGLRYSKERQSFGKFLHQHQAISFYLADMATEIEASRLLLWRAAMKEQTGGKWSLEASQAKLFASATAVKCANLCVQILGGAGYMNDYPAERLYRDAKITEIYEGTSEIQRLVIAAAILKD